MEAEIIITAFISAVSAIFVAYLDYRIKIRTIPSSKKNDKVSIDKKTKVKHWGKLDKNEKIWVWLLLLLIPWLIVFGVFIREYHPFNFLFIIPALTLIISIFYPIRFLLAMGIVFVLHTFFIITYSIPSPLEGWVFVGIFVYGNSLGCGAICQRQIRKKNIS